MAFIRVFVREIGFFFSSGFWLLGSGTPISAFWGFRGGSRSWFFLSPRLIIGILGVLVRLGCYNKCEVLGRTYQSVWTNLCE